MCCTLRLVSTSMPASRIAITSCQRLGALGARHVGVRELVHHGHLRMPRDHRIGIHVFEDGAAMLDRLLRGTNSRPSVCAMVSLRPCGSK